MQYYMRILDSFANTIKNCTNFCTMLFLKRTYKKLSTWQKVWSQSSFATNDQALKRHKGCLHKVSFFLILRYYFFFSTILRFLMFQIALLSRVGVRKSTQSFGLGKPVSRWFQAALVKLADVKTDCTMKKVVAYKEALGDKARNPTSDGCLSRDNRRLAWHRVSGLFDRFLIDVKPQIVAIYLRRVSPPSLFVEIVVPWKSTPQWARLLWRAKQALCKTMKTTFILRHFLFGANADREGRRFF